MDFDTLLAAHKAAPPLPPRRTGAVLVDGDPDASDLEQAEAIATGVSAMLAEPRHIRAVFTELAAVRAQLATSNRNVLLLGALTETTLDTLDLLAEGLEATAAAANAKEAN